MIALNWIGSISSHHPSVAVRMADTLLDWIARDRELRQLAALDDRALADFGGNRCTVDSHLTEKS